MQSIFTRKILVCAVLLRLLWVPLQLVQPRKPVSTVLSIRVSA